MTLPDLLSDALVRMAATSAWTALLGKATLLLALAWLLQASLARANPRWRVLLWRGAAVGLVLLPAGALGLPALEVRIEAPKPAAPGAAAAELAAKEPAAAVAPPSVQPVAVQREPAGPAQPSALSTEVSAPIEMTAVSPPTSVQIGSEAVPAPEARQPAVPWPAILLGVWGLGALALLTRLATGYLRLARLLRASPHAPSEAVAAARRIAAALGCRRPVEVRSSRQCAVPFLCGLWRPVVVLPERMGRASYHSQLPGVLAHELAHVRSRDWGWSAGLQVVSILLWFHPLVWRIGAAHRAACDAVCDAVSASYLGDVRGYCCTLARIALEAVSSARVGALAMARACDVRRRIAALERTVFAWPLHRLTMAGVALPGLLAAVALAGVRWTLADSPPAGLEQTAAVSATAPAPAGTGQGQQSSKTAPQASAKPGFRPMRIRVTDRDGKPVAGAEITTSAVIRRTLARVGVSKYQANPEGVATIEVPEEEASYLVIFARADGYVTAGARWEVRGAPDPVPAEFDFTLEPGTTIGGTVRDEQGRPIAGALVTLSGQENVPGGRRFNRADDGVRTDADGKWVSRRVPKVLSGYSARITLQHPDYASPPFFDFGTQPIEPLRARTAVMVMRKGIALEGTVTDPQGRPMAKIQVGLFPEHFESVFPRATTDSQGHYRFPACEPGDYTIAAAAPGYAPASRRLKVDPSQRTADLQLTKGEAIRLRFVDQQGKPVPEASVNRFLPHEKPALMLVDWPRPADAEGRWSCVWIPNDGIELIFRKPGYAEVRKTVAPGPREQVITLEKGSAWIVSGRVVDRQSKAPVPRFRVVEGYAHSTGDSDYDLTWREARPMENPSGQYSIQWDTPGDSRRVIRIEADGYFPSQSRRLMADERRVTFDVELSKGQPVAGTVRAPDGKPLADADVVLCTAARRIYLRNGTQFERDRSIAARTGADGRFSLPPQRDPYVLVVLHDRGYAEVEDEAESGNITVQPWARVEGTLRIGKRPGANEHIRLGMFEMQDSRRPAPRRPAAGRVWFHYETQTDKQGRFVFNRVWPGEAQLMHVITLANEGSTLSMTFTRSLSVVLSPGETLKRDLGGTGRPVIGRLVLPIGSRGPLDLSGNPLRAERLLPDVPWPEQVKQMPPLDARFSESEWRSRWWQQRKEWQDQWLASEAGKGYRGDRTAEFGTGLKQDGSFCFDDLPPGDYLLVALLYPREALVRGASRDPVGRLFFEFRVPEMPGARSDEPLDLGSLVLDPPDAR